MSELVDHLEKNKNKIYMSRNKNVCIHTQVTEIEECPTSALGKNGNSVGLHQEKGQQVMNDS